MPTAAKKAPARGANPSEAVSHLADVTDRMHGLLMERADTLMGGTGNSPEEAYERQRWPDGRIPGGKG